MTTRMMVLTLALVAAVPRPGLAQAPAPASGLVLAPLALYLTLADD